MSTLLDEIKHSFKTHMAMMGGPTAQLAVFAIKLVDFLEDGNQERTQQEMAQLSLSVVEALALYLEQSFQHHEKLAVNEGKQFPAALTHAGTNILLMVAQAKKNPDKIAAKYGILKVMARALEDLGSYRNTKYPTITDLSGNQL